MVAQLLFAAATGQEQRQREAGIILADAGIDEHLLDAWQGVARQLAADAVVGGYLAPAGDLAADRFELRLQLRAAGVCSLGIVWQEHQAGSEACGDGDAGFTGQQFQERIGAAQQQAAAIAGQAIGGDAAAVGHARKRGDGCINQQARRLIVELGDHAKSTGIALGARVVKPLAVAGAISTSMRIGLAATLVPAHSLERIVRPPDASTRSQVAAAPQYTVAGATERAGNPCRRAVELSRSARR